MGAPQNVTDLLDRASGKFCLTWGVVELAEWLRRKAMPWRWKRELRWWEPAANKRETLEKFQLKERKIPMIGNGQFRFDENGRITHLTVEAVLQPHTPAEHDMFDRQGSAEGGHGREAPVGVGSGRCGQNRASGLDSGSRGCQCEGAEDGSGSRGGDCRESGSRRSGGSAKKREACGLAFCVMVQELD